MRNKYLILLPLAGVLFMTSCVSVTKIGKGIDKDDLEYSKKNVDLTKDFDDTYNEFVANASLLAKDTNNNTCMSPISLYSALSMLAFSTSGNTKAQILNYMQTSEEELTKNYKELYKASAYYDSNIDDYRELLTNSLWFDNDFSFKEDGINNVANNSCSNIFKIDFKNPGASDYISDYLKDETNDLIDQKIDISPDTKLVLLNSLYLNDPWLRFGDEIELSDEKYKFTNNDNSIYSDYFLYRKYNGKIYTNEEIRAMSVYTYHYFKITFIVPNDNYKINDVFNKQNIISAINTKYDEYDTELYNYQTTVYFPKFKAESKYDFSNNLKNLGISDVFDLAKADFSPITDNKISCDKIIHSSKIEVDRKGIIGAAETYVAVSMAGRYSYDVYQDFIVDRPFGYLVSDQSNRVLFSGIINNVS